MKSMFAGLLLMTSSMAWGADKTPVEEPTSHPNWTEVREQAEAQLKDALVDPESAQIAWTKGFFWSSWKSGNLGMLNKRKYGWVACGTLNAKNRLGGYAGREKVIVVVQADGTRKTGMAYSIDGPCSYDDERFGPVVEELK